MGILKKTRSDFAKSPLYASVALLGLVLPATAAVVWAWQFREYWTLFVLFGALPAFLIWSGMDVWRELRTPTHTITMVSGLVQAFGTISFNLALLAVWIERPQKPSATSG